MRIKIWYFPISLFLLFVIIGSMQNIHASIKTHADNLTTIDGLSHNSVRYIFQDSKGFIWMSSLNGLNRYDGNSFRIFQPNKSQQLSLVDRRVKHLYEDKHGFLWISTSAEQFSCYDLKHECFVDFTGCGQDKDKYSKITLLPNEVWLWGKEHGCRRIIYKEGKFISQVFNREEGSLHSNEIYFVEEGLTSEEVWIGTNNGLYYWNGTSLQQIGDGHFTRFHRFEDKVGFITIDGEIWLTDNTPKISKVFQLHGLKNATDLTGDLAIGSQWIIFTKFQTFVFNIHTQTLERTPDKWNIPNGETLIDNRGNYWIYNKTGMIYYILSQTGEVKRIRLMPEKTIGHIDMERYHVVHDSRNIIWISTYGNGLFTYDMETDELTHHQASDKRSSLITTNQLHYIMEDRTGSIWIGSEHSGVTHLKISNEETEHFLLNKEKPEDLYANNIRHITQTSVGDIHLSTRDGNVYVYDSTLTQLKAQNSYHNNIYTIAEDSAGSLWLGSRGDGIFVNDRHYTYNGHSNSISYNDVYTIFQDSQKRMWIGTLGGGLNLAIPDSIHGYWFKYFFNKTYSQKRIRTLIEDYHGRIWAGTSDGIYVFYPDELLKDENAYQHFNWENDCLNSNEIRSLMIDRKGNVYIAEAGTGFAICTPGQDLEDLTFTHYGVDDGLVNSMVQAFAEDKYGKIWISTEYGISCFIPETQSFENYYFSDDMLSNVYNENCMLALPDGRFIVGSNKGATIIETTKINVSPSIREVTFTDIKLNGISVSSDMPDSPFEHAMSYSDGIHLNHSQNSFVINFSTLDYSTITPYKYSYYLEGYDKEWSTPSTLSSATYKNLLPGSYQLKVKSCNSIGLWSNESCLNIVITPPFWQTSYAYLLYAVILLTAIYIIYRTLHKMATLRNKVKLEKQMTEYKLVFFTNISHEFRTPLTLIQASLEKMRLIKKLPKEMEHSMRIMEKSILRMQRLVNQLMEFRKMQNNKLELSLEETDVIHFIDEIHQCFKEVAQSKKIEYKFTPFTDSYHLFIDRGYVDKIIYNLISNAMKYTPSGGNVECTIARNETQETLTIQVSDTGVGIPKEKRDSLFKRFTQSRFSGGSMGIGLHLTYELVRKHHGSISYSENPVGGSIFTVTLPINASVYEEKDFLIPNNALLKEEHAKEQGKAETKQPITKNIQSTPNIEIQPLNKHKLLVIEDDTDVRELLKQELSVYFDVVAEADGQSGVEYAIANEVDLIVCDVMMPGISGFEVTCKLKENFATSHIPIILLTAQSAEENHLKGVECGADAYITKPFSLQLLNTRVLKLIEQREKLHEKFSTDLSMVRPIISTNRQDKKFIDKITRIIEKNMENPDFCAEDFASEMALGRTVFYKKIKGITGYSPKEYLRIMRMKKAAELLLDPDITISEVSAQVGIGDSFYFSRCFKAQFGVAPSVFQKNKGKIPPQTKNIGDAKV